MLKVKRAPYRSGSKLNRIKPGWVVETVNRTPIQDIIDFRFEFGSGEGTVRFRKPDGGTSALKLTEEQAVQIEFEPLRPRQCPNDCIFCFVHQMPSGFRKSLYIKDEDYRFSFLYGSYLTLTNLSKTDLDRIVAQRLSPLYVSVHTTDLDMREHMLGSRQARKILDILGFLSRNRITMHTQIVVCPGINDEKKLEETVLTLSQYYPYVASIAIVPVGLTKHRSGLPRLRPVGPRQADSIVKEARKWHRRFRRKWKRGFVYLSDELFLLAGERLPASNYYDEYPQIENGVGMVRQFIEHLASGSLLFPPGLDDATLVTGELFAPLLSRHAASIGNAPPEIEVIGVENSLFGGQVTVAGLLSGADILKATASARAQHVFVSPDCVDSQERFIDNLTVKKLSRITGKTVHVGLAD